MELVTVYGVAMTPAHGTGPDDGHVIAETLTPFKLEAEISLYRLQYAERQDHLHYVVEKSVPKHLINEVSANEI